MIVDYGRNKNKKDIRLVNLSLLIVLILGLIGCVNMSSNDIVKSIDSPNGEYRAIAFIRDCGATTDFSPQVTLLKKGHKFRNVPGNIFIGNHSKFIDISWKDDSTLIITYDCDKKDIFKQEKNKYGVHIIYNHQTLKNSK